MLSNFLKLRRPSPIATFLQRKRQTWRVISAWRHLLYCSLRRQKVSIVTKALWKKEHKHEKRGFLPFRNTITKNLTIHNRSIASSVICFYPNKLKLGSAFSLQSGLPPTSLVPACQYCLSSHPTYSRLAEHEPKKIIQTKSSATQNTQTVAEGQRTTLLAGLFWVFLLNHWINSVADDEPMLEFSPSLV